jgi:hypothetical protein
LNRSAAEVAVAKLMAAYPREWFDEATVAVYVDAVEKLRSPEAIADAVNALIRSEPKLPSIALLCEEYRRNADRYAPKALPEPELTDEDRAENVRRIRELATSIGRSADEPATGEENG